MARNQHLKTENRIMVCREYAQLWQQFFQFFADELEDLHLPHFRIIHVLRRSSGRMPAYKGRIDTKVIRSEMDVDLQDATFLISGSPVMVKETEGQLALLGVSSSRVRVERFLGYT